MVHDYVAPTYQADAYHCPHCNTYAHQVFGDVFQRVGKSVQMVPVTMASVCQRCGARAWWVDATLVFPDAPGGLPADPDMPADVAIDYNEARAILSRSPRGACALLRLGLQKLCADLGEPGENLNEDIASLVKKGLLPRVQQALDALRVIGNNAVHPGAIDLRDDQKTATALFGTMNLIVEQLITVPKATAALYQNLPQTALDQISRRDTPAG